MNRTNFKENQLIIYMIDNSFRIGKIKWLNDDGAFVWYHSGETASKTPYEYMHPLENEYCIKTTILGGEMVVQNESR